MQFLIVLSISTSHHYIGHTRQGAMLQICANLSSNVLVSQVRLKKKQKSDNSSYSLTSQLALERSSQNILNFFLF
jgi:hypothetical protein